MNPRFTMSFRRRNPSVGVALSILAFSLVPLADAVRAAESPDFTREVRPILARYCFQCHGPDDKQREAGLRLDTSAGAVKSLDSGRQAIAPNKPDDSELLARITSTDPDTVMPPPTTKKTMTAAEKTILRRWIAAGAEYQPHWAFQPPRQAPLPKTSDSAWLRSPLDAHVLAGIDSAGLRHSPSAGRETLVRRLSLDLIGLPPTLDEIDAFLADTGPDAEQRLVDRLLASPAYGERWARRWLDLARYADTNGYEKDRQRSMWPYRDWVIRALNADLPFDQFTIEQIAGDMLPDATLDQRTATGFHRNTMINEEGGIDPLEFRYLAMVDRVNTTGTTWLGLTLVCANCHTHKYDPIPQQEYFQLFALLNNADELEMDVPSADLAERRDAVERQIAAKERDLASQFPPAGDVRWSVATPKTVTAAAGSNLKIQPDQSVLVGGPLPEKDDYVVTFESGAEPITALRLETLVDPSLGSGGPGRTKHGNFVLSELTIKVEPLAGGAPAKSIKIARATADVEQPMFPVTAAFDGQGNTGWAVHDPKLPLNQPRTATFHFDAPVTLSGGGRWTITLGQQFGSQHLIGRFRLSLGRETSDDRPLETRRRAHLEQKFGEWLAAQSQHATRWTVVRPTSAKSNLPLLAIQNDQTIRATGDQSKSDLYEVSFPTGGRPITAIRIEALPDDLSPKHGPGRVYYEGPHGDFWLSDIALAAGSGGDRAKFAVHRFARASQTFAAANSSAAAAIDDNKQTGWSINGGQGKPHVAVFNLAQPLAGVDMVDLRMLFERYYAAGLGLFRVSITDDPDATASSLPPDVELALAKSAAEQTAADRELLLRYFLTIAPELAGARQEIERLRASIPAAPTSLVFQERPPANPRPTFRHHRGEFLQPKEAVSPDVLKLLPPLGADQPKNRLGLARWLVSPHNPLVGRVTMNRHWQAIFGRGIVRTTEDFGYQGEPPANAALLDWLAVELVRQDWSLKAMHRAIVTSATYGQSSDVTPDLLAGDPLNDRLARGPRIRIEAEAVRDSLLRASGLLSSRLGGPSVFPSQPSNVTTEGAYGQLSWQASPGGDRYRRGLYTFAKRTAPYAMFTTFDGPSGEACVARRDISNTPLQALTLLNDSVLIEAARALGRDASEWPAPAGAETAARIDYLFRRCLTRRPTSDEAKLLADFHDAQRRRFASGQLAPQPLAGEGAADPAERAAWVATARAILNLDEMVVKQ